MNKLSVQIIGLIAFIGIAVAALYYGGVFENAEEGSQSATVERTARKVHMLKYSDYSCPACKSYVPVQNRLKEEFGDMIEIEYRYFPLENFPHSMLAALSVEAAKQQDKGKEMHDLIFEYQQAWSPQQADAQGFFVGFAENIGLDIDQFLEDIESEEVERTVLSQRDEGVRRTVNSTPSFFIDGHKLRQNPQSYEQFKSIVELYMYRN